MSGQFPSHDAVPTVGRIAVVRLIGDVHDHEVIPIQTIGHLEDSLISGEDAETDQAFQVAVDQPHLPETLPQIGIKAYVQYSIAVDLLQDRGSALGLRPRRQRLDRKSTRLNSSHVAISYAV